MAIIGLQKGSGKRSRVREKSVKSQGILIWTGNPDYPCSENKGADQLRGYREVDLRLGFRICKNLVFS